MKSVDSFGVRSTLAINGKNHFFYDLKRLNLGPKLAKLPYCLKILLENLLRFEDNVSVTKTDILTLANWDPKTPSETEIAFTPARVILQDFTGVPAVVDLAAMRHAMRTLNGNPLLINPLSPVELVIDHSVMVDYYGNNDAFQQNVTMEFGRNEERYAFLRWGQTAFQNFRVVPPGTGIVHQVNLEYLARVIFNHEANSESTLYPDTLVGTDSHTTMINGLGVLGWGVGGIEAEAAMLGQPVTMLIPEVVGFKFIGQLPAGTTATDLVLVVTEMLRRKNVVGKFVEFFGDGLEHLPLADRATIGNMAPEYGATCGIFPIDAETLRYMRLSGRDETAIQTVEAYSKAQGIFRELGAADANYSDILTLDLSTVVPSIAGPKRPQDRIALKQSKEQFQNLLALQNLSLSTNPTQLDHGSVAIAAITSCTNTSNPDLMIGSGLLAQKALEKGLKCKPWVKTSFAPGSQVVTDYLEKANLMKPLDDLGFNLVGYGCTTCIGNSGPLLPAISQEIKTKNLAVAAVLSGNRNFEGRIHPEVRYAYLASPPLVVAYALAGTMHIDFEQDALGMDKNGKPVFLRDIWPTRSEIAKTIESSVKGELYKTRYRDVFNGDTRWKTLQIPEGEQFDWKDTSTYVKLPPYFEGIQATPPRTLKNIEKARVLAFLGDSVTTDHISPAGDIAKNSPAADYLQKHGIAPADFNSYGSRRGNHEVMMRGTFANIRLKNKLVGDTEGNWTIHFPTGEKVSIFDAAMRYKEVACPLILIAGKEYGTGSSRDWAAKGPRLLGVQAVIAESFERIHRSNLIGMGILPLQFPANENSQSLKLAGDELFSIELEGLTHRGEVTVKALKTSGDSIYFKALVRIDTPKELEYYQHGGILQYVLRQLLAKKGTS